MLGGELCLAFRHLSHVHWYGLPHLLYSLTTRPIFMQSSFFAAHEGGKHRARLCPVFCGDLPRARFVQILWTLACASMAARGQLFIVGFEAFVLGSTTVSRVLFWTHSRTDPHAPLFQLSAIFIRCEPVLSRNVLGGVRAAVSRDCRWPLCSRVDFAFSVIFTHLAHRESSRSVSLWGVGKRPETKKVVVREKDLEVEMVKMDEL